MLNVREKIRSLTESISEENNLIRFVQSCNLEYGSRILDVGCGHGKYTILLGKLGYKVLGVDINPNIVNKNKEAGLDCLTVKEFQTNFDKFDLIIMSHIIEHFHPSDLFPFVNHYLSRLKDRGYLIIATPLYSNTFYNDFDHIRPYQPWGINMVFSIQDPQVQYQSNYRLEIKDIWFRRQPFRLNYCAGLYLNTYSQLPKIINSFSSMIYHLTFGIIGRIDGWIGLYMKIDR